jgi:hypothetical protein
MTAYTPNNSKIRRPHKSLIKRKRKLSPNQANQFINKYHTKKNVIKQKNDSATLDFTLNNKKPSKSQKYTILKKLGEGSSTKVYKAQNNITGEIVAIKYFSIDVLNDPDSKSYLEVFI